MFPDYLSVSCDYAQTNTFSLLIAILFLFPIIWFFNFDLFAQKNIFLKIEFQSSIQDWVFLPHNGPKKVLRMNPEWRYHIHDTLKHVYTMESTIQISSYKKVFKGLTRPPSSTNYKHWAVRKTGTKLKILIYKEITKINLITIPWAPLKVNFIFFQIKK